MRDCPFLRGSFIGGSTVFSHNGCVEPLLNNPHLVQPTPLGSTHAPLFSPRPLVQPPPRGLLQGMSLLHWACDRGHLEAVKVLVDKGAEVNMQEQEDLQTPLHYGGFGGAPYCTLE